MEWYYLVAAIDGSSGELIADIDAKPPATLEDPEAFCPDPVKVREVLMKGLPVADLPFDGIVLEVPIRR